MRSYVSYLRVSTNRQGQSGLGLEAQRKSVGQYVSLQQGELVAEFVEVESGAKSGRPVLNDAIRKCRKSGHILVIAKLDRLARNVSFISSLMEAGVEFVAVDAPYANKLMLHILAAFAEHEREQISIRTRQALAAAKANGVELGKNGRRLAARNKARAIQFAESNRAVFEAIVASGSSTLTEIASQLNDQGIQSAENGKWYASSVARVLDRLGIKH